MNIVQLTATTGTDGKLRFEIPAEPNGEFEIAVIVQAKPKMNGGVRKPTPEELGWPPGFLESVVGVIDDDTFVRPPQGDYPKREVFD